MQAKGLWWRHLQGGVTKLRRWDVPGPWEMMLMHWDQWQQRLQWRNQNFTITWSMGPMEWVEGHWMGNVEVGVRWCCVKMVYCVWPMYGSTGVNNICLPSSVVHTAVGDKINMTTQGACQVSQKNCSSLKPCRGCRVCQLESS